MFRHTALFRLRADVTEAQRDEMLRRLPTLRENCASVRAQDFGVNALPGLGPAGAYDVALHLDFDDAAGYRAYFEDPGHKDVAAFNASITVAEQTARVDWLPGDQAPGPVRHVATFVWANGREQAALDAAESLRSHPGVTSVSVAENAGDDARAWDWLLDVRLESLEAAHELLAASEAYLEVLAAVNAAVETSRIAHVTHLTRR